MMNENDLMSRLVASKAIMDSPKFSKSSNSMNGGLPPTSLQDFDMPQARYNIPQEFLQESQPVNQPYLSSLPKENTKPVGVPSVDAIKSSKLPDEIKKLMLEHPIAQPQQVSATLSDDLIERMIKEAVDEALQENGLMVESSEKANEMLSFKVGKHVFEGKVTKIKKLI
jgi:hypothetical protein